MPALPDPSCYARARYPGHTVRARIWWSTPVAADERTPSKLCPVGHGGFTHANGHLLSPPRRPMLTFLISRRQPNEGPEFGWVSSTRGHLTGCSSGAFKFAPYWLTTVGRLVVDHRLFYSTRSLLACSSPLRPIGPRSARGRAGCFLLQCGTSAV